MFWRQWVSTFLGIDDEFSQGFAESFAGTTNVDAVVGLKERVANVGLWRPRISGLIAALPGVLLVFLSQRQP